MGTSKNIIVCTSSDAVGGIARVNNYLQDLLTQKDINTTVVSYKISSSKLLQKALFWQKLQLSLQSGSKIIFTHMHLAGVLKAITGRYPYMVLVHGLEIKLDEHSDYQEILSEADELVVNSKKTKNDIQKHYGIDNVTHCYYPPAKFDKSNIDCKKMERPTILLVGRMEAAERYKGHDELIEIWPDVKEKIPDARLVFVGTGNDAPRLQQKVEKLGLSNDILFKKNVSDKELAEYYAKSWAFCMPSSGEGQGLVYSEAMQFGLPVIALKNSPAAELIDDRKSGILVEQNDAESLNKAIVQILSDDKMRKKMSENAKKRYEKFYRENTFDETIMNFVGAD